MLRVFPCCAAVRVSEFYVPVASQRESREAGDTLLAEVRFPADRGVGGWVLEHGEAVQDAAHDARFYSGVDRLTNLTTHAILCAPLRTRSGIIGVIEVINPAHGRPPKHRGRRPHSPVDDAALPLLPVAPLHGWCLPPGPFRQGAVDGAPGSAVARPVARRRADARDRVPGRDSRLARPACRRAARRASRGDRLSSSPCRSTLPAPGR